MFRACRSAIIAVLACALAAVGNATADPAPVRPLDLKAYIDGCARSGIALRVPTVPRRAALLVSSLEAYGETERTMVAHALGLNVRRAESREEWVRDATVRAERERWVVTALDALLVFLRGALGEVKALSPREAQEFWNRALALGDRLAASPEDDELRREFGLIFDEFPGSRRDRVVVSHLSGRMLVAALERRPVPAAEARSLFRALAAEDAVWHATGYRHSTRFRPESSPPPPWLAARWMGGTVKAYVAAGDPQYVSGIRILVPDDLVSDDVSSVLAGLRPFVAPRPRAEDSLAEAFAPSLAMIAEAGGWNLAVVLPDAAWGLLRWWDDLATDAPRFLETLAREAGIRFTVKDGWLVGTPVSVDVGQALWFASGAAGPRRADQDALRAAARAVEPDPVGLTTAYAARWGGFGEGFYADERDGALALELLRRGVSPGGSRIGERSIDEQARIETALRRTLDPTALSGRDVGRWLESGEFREAGLEVSVEEVDQIAFTDERQRAPSASLASAAGWGKYLAEQFPGMSNARDAALAMGPRWQAVRAARVSAVVTVGDIRVTSSFRLASPLPDADLWSSPVGKATEEAFRAAREASAGQSGSGARAGGPPASPRP